MTALVCLGWADQTDIARETHLDQSSSGRLRAETANAALPLPIVKMRAWETVVEPGALSNDVLTAIISGFVAPAALPITEMYVDEYFERLAGFWADNSIEIARRLVLGLYPKWSMDEEASSSGPMPGSRSIRMLRRRSNGCSSSAGMTSRGRSTSRRVRLHGTDRGGVVRLCLRHCPRWSSHLPPTSADTMFFP